MPGSASSFVFRFLSFHFLRHGRAGQLLQRASVQRSWSSSTSSMRKPSKTCRHAMESASIAARTLSWRRASSSACRCWLLPVACPCLPSKLSMQMQYRLHSEISHHVLTILPGLSAGPQASHHTGLLCVGMPSFAFYAHIANEMYSHLQ